MPLSIILICPKSINIEQIKMLIEKKEEYKTYYNKFDDCIIEKDNLYVSLNFNNECQDDYFQEFLESEDLPSNLRKILNILIFINITYNNTLLLYKIIKLIFKNLINSIDRIWIDNDNAITLQGSTVLKNISKGVL